MPYRFTHLLGVLPVVLGNMFIFLLAGHEAGPSLYSDPIVTKTLLLDLSLHAVLLIWAIGPLSGCTRDIVPTHQRRYVQPEWNTCMLYEPPLI